jgi:hypothetical protein
MSKYTGVWALLVVGTLLSLSFAAANAAGPPQDDRQPATTLLAEAQPQTAAAQAARPSPQADRKQDEDKAAQAKPPSFGRELRSGVNVLGCLGVAVWLTDRLGVWDIGHNGRQLAAGAFVVSIFF